MLKLSPEARRLRAVEADFKNLIAGNTTIHEIVVKNGMMTINATSNAFHFLSLMIIEYMDSLGAKNFVEHDCELRLWSGPVGMRITVQRAEGKSPATLKAEAEERARVAEAQIAKIHEVLANAQSYSQGELLSEIALIVDWARPVETSQKYDPSVIITLPDKAEIARNLVAMTQKMDSAELSKRLGEEIEKQTPLVSAEAHTLNGNIYSMEAIEEAAKKFPQQ